VAGIGNDQDEKALGAELAQRPLRQRDVTKMRRVKGAAENGRRQRVTVSSPTSTSAPDFAPAARRAS
jgi:hypothetical protein